MSHFSVCVAIPASKLLGVEITQDSIMDIANEIIERYCESTEERQFLEFCDCTDEAKAEYESHRVGAIRYPDGRIVTTHSSDVPEGTRVVEYIDIAKEGSKLADGNEDGMLIFIPELPVKAIYSFDDYCQSYCGYEINEDGRIGYWRNPNAKWDWFEIGGRFAGKLLAEQNAEGILPTEEEFEDEPNGFYFIDGARKGNIAWKKLQELHERTSRNSYNTLVNAFQNDDMKRLGSLCQKDEDGIFAFGIGQLYKKGETFEEYCRRCNVYFDRKYAFGAFAFVDKEGNWIGSADMGWWGATRNKKEVDAWTEEFQACIEKLDDDDFLVMLDCHI